MTRFDRLALIFSIAAIVITAWLSQAVYERLPHLEDEMAYYWQAQTIAGGHLSLSSPSCPACFLVPFVVDYHGQRFAKYPPAWPVVLSVGILLHAPYMVNAFLAGLCVWLTYRLGKKILSEWVGIVAAFLTLASPFFLLNSASLLSHTWAMVLSAAFALAWLDAFNDSNRIPHWLTALVAALSLGLLALTRPLTAVGVALPFFFHGLVLIWRGSREERQKVLLIGSLAGLVSLLLFAWQLAMTGNAFLNPYTLWWPYDRIGFGPGVGTLPQGNTLFVALNNSGFSLFVGASDLFGWGRFSWIFLPVGIWAVRRTKHIWLINCVFPSLVLTYLLYWVGAWVYGPRYYFEGLFSLTILSAAGITYLAGPLIRMSQQKRTIKWTARLRPMIVYGLVIGLISTNLLYYSPARLGSLKEFNQVEQASLEPFQTAAAKKLAPALVIVFPGSRWTSYGRLLTLENPYFDTPFIFSININSSINQTAIQAFPKRTVIYYYPDEPNQFYLSPK